MSAVCCVDKVNLEQSLEYAVDVNIRVKYNISCLSPLQNRRKSWGEPKLYKEATILKKEVERPSSHFS